MNSKERAGLRSRAMDIKPVFSVGKSGVTPELTQAVSDALRKRELIKINVLKNCESTPEETGITLAGRTRSQLVETVGRKIVLYKENPELRKKEKDRSGKNHTVKRNTKKNAGPRTEKKGMRHGEGLRAGKKSTGHSTGVHAGKISPGRNKKGLHRNKNR